MSLLSLVLDIQKKVQEEEREERMGVKNYRIFNWKKNIGILFVLSALRGRS